MGREGKHNKSSTHSEVQTPLSECQAGGRTVVNKNIVKVEMRAAFVLTPIDSCLLQASDYCRFNITQTTTFILNSRRDSKAQR